MAMLSDYFQCLYGEPHNAIAAEEKYGKTSRIFRIIHSIFTISCILLAANVAYVLVDYPDSTGGILATKILHLFKIPLLIIAFATVLWLSKKHSILVNVISAIILSGGLYVIYHDLIPLFIVGGAFILSIFLRRLLVNAEE